MNDLYPKMAEILEVDEVKPESVLQDFEYWDSLTALSIIAMMDSDFCVTLTAVDLRKMKTARELSDFVTEHKRK